MSKGFWAIIIAIIVIFGGFLWFKDHKANAPSTTAQTSNHVEGNGQKGVTLIEYGDYECPFCEQYYPVVKQVVAQYNNEIKFEFRNLPLSQIHQNAFAASRAAEAAGLQNKFWEMHDMLYENQSSWVNASDPQTVFSQFAQQLGLNVTQFKQDFSSSKVNDLINGDIAAFNKTGQEMATPTFFLDGKKISPNITFESDQKTVNVPASAAAFSQLIAKEIATKK
ncbi:MAG TPA: thioredoxin domain-containing protein [Candidatus Saccharimonadales bacterium]|nr:thioredoxin domain-containing protein [Candidatus Saccharimonadales bacterium]